MKRSECVIEMITGIDGKKLIISIMGVDYKDLLPDDLKYKFDDCDVINIVDKIQLESLVELDSKLVIYDLIIIDNMKALYPSPDYSEKNSIASKLSDIAKTNDIAIIILS